MVLGRAKSDFGPVGLKCRNMGKGERRGLGLRNDVLTTCKAVTSRGGHRIIVVGFL